MTTPHQPRKASVLIATANDDLYTRISKILTRFGFLIHKVSNKRILLKKVLFEQPKLLLIDEHLPDLNFEELKRETSENPAIRRRQMILMRRTQEKHVLIDAQFDRVLIYPFHIMEFAFVVSHLLDHQLDFREIGRKSLEELILVVLSRAPNKSSKRENLVTAVLKLLRVNTRGEPRKKFAKKIDFAVTSLQSKQLVEEYRTQTNHRVRLSNQKLADDILRGRIISLGKNSEDSTQIKASLPVDELTIRLETASDDSLIGSAANSVSGKPVNQPAESISLRPRSRIPKLSFAGGDLTSNTINGELASDNGISDPIAKRSPNYSEKSLQKSEKASTRIPKLPAHSEPNQINSQEQSAGISDSRSDSPWTEKDNAAKADNDNQPASKLLDIWEGDMREEMPEDATQGAEKVELKDADVSNLGNSIPDSDPDQVLQYIKRRMSGQPGVKIKPDFGMIQLVLNQQLRVKIQVAGPQHDLVIKAFLPLALTSLIPILESYAVNDKIGTLSIEKSFSKKWIVIKYVALQNSSSAQEVYISLLQIMREAVDVLKIMESAGESGPV